MKYIILDLDGTISDDKWREKFINLREQGQYRWHDYHLLAGFDLVCNEQLFRQTEHDIIIITSRSLMYRVITMQWLHINNIQPKYIAFRPSKSTLPSADVKNGLLTSLMLQHSIKLEDIKCAYDDCHEVCVMYRKMGLQAIQVLDRRKDDEVS